MSALRWSYNHLPRHLKMCFTYCSLFPKDHVFIEKVLVEMWMAHDLIQKEKQKRPEDVGAHYFEQLVNASFLQCVDGKYTMHDLIHDLALLVSNDEFATANSSISNDQMEKVRHITITPNDYSKIPRLCKMEKLLTLYTTGHEIFTTEKFDNSVLDDVFKQLKSIRVLVLDSSKITHIPDSISELKHLRYLDVSKTRVERLPDSLCRLYNLQMLAVPLDVEIPRDIVNMVNLRYVKANLSTCKAVGKLTSLQELSSIRVCEGDNIRELGDMQRLRGKLRIEGLENVEKFEGDVGALMERQTLMDELELKFDKQLEKSTIFEEVLDSLGCPPNLTFLRIYGYTGVKPPSWMVDRKHKFAKLQTLELSNCPKLESLPPLGELTSLKYISLENVGIKRLGDEFYGNLTKRNVFFPNLESLRFDDLQEWTEWDDIIIENSSVSFFPRLTRLEINKCSKLVLVLPTVSNAANFMTSLSGLEIRNCHGLKRLQLDALVSLKGLDIGQCSSLVRITSAKCLATTVEGLIISDCEHLETMDFESLPSIKHLEIELCHKLISVLKLDGCESLKRLCIKSCSQFQSLSLYFHKFSSLEELYIVSCPQLQSLPPDFHSLSSLELLYINDCPQLQSLPLDIHKLSSLKSLILHDCLQLQSLPSDFHKFSSLESLGIIDCPQFQSLPPDFHKLSSLRSLNIIFCLQLQSLPPDFHKLSSLETLNIMSCPQLQSLPPDFHKLSSLKNLCINFCPQLPLPVDAFPPSLRELSITGCND